eukprot:scaffold36274_cov125-Isochrysis_galbana.AAC.21
MSPPPQHSTGPEYPFPPAHWPHIAAHGVEGGGDGAAGCFTWPHAHVWVRVPAAAVVSDQRPPRICTRFWRRARDGAGAKVGVGSGSSAVGGDFQVVVPAERRNRDAVALQRDVGFLQQLPLWVAGAALWRLHHANVENARRVHVELVAQGRAHRIH